jgi:predicted ATPase
VSVRGLRVAFAGASGTGKTSLARYVADTYQIAMNPIGSRQVAAAMGFASPYDVDKAGKRAEFQRRLLEEKYTWEKQNDAFVTDRTVADNLTYTALHDVYSIDEQTTDWVARGLAHYTHVFFCTMSSFFNLGNDPMRVQTRAYHEVFERCLMGILQPGLSRDARYYWFLPGFDTLEKRQDFVKDAIGPR